LRKGACATHDELGRRTQKRRAADGAMPLSCARIRSVVPCSDVDGHQAMWDRAVLRSKASATQWKSPRPQRPGDRKRSVRAEHLVKDQSGTGRRVAARDKDD